MNRLPFPRIAFLLSAMLLGLAPAVPVALAQTPTVAYQGYLTDTNGTAAAGTASVTFRLYDRTSGGTALWQETQQNVAFIDGIFSVRLGSIVSLEEVSFNRPLWLGVSVAGSPELAPRVALEAVPYAMSVRGLRVEPVVDPQQGFTLNMIGGHPGNAAAADVFGATIGGGGADDNANIVTADFGTIGGGADNQAGSSATVGGGIDNTAEGESATIAGGLLNTASGTLAAVGGGGGNRAEAASAVIAGGSSNTASGDFTSVGGGVNNQATDEWATVGGGNDNDALAQSTVVAGGDNNVAEGGRATIGGGGFNAAQGVAATVPGGQGNWAHGDNSFAAGFQARTEHNGTFVWADFFSISDPPFVSTASQQFLVRARGGVGIGTNAPQGALHVADQSLDIDPNDFADDALVVEGNRPLVGIYGAFQGGTRPGLILAGVDNGAVVDRWGVVREYFGNNRLHFSYGLNDDYTQNATVLSLSLTEGPVADRFTATQDLGSTGTPSPGGHFRDNVVYAWAHVQPNGSVTSSYGCTVSKITGTGSYRVTFKRQLPNGASAVVTPQTLNDPVIATAVTSAAQADVATKVFNGAAFVPFDSGFYIQVVGRP